MASKDRLLLAQLDVSIRGLEKTMSKAGISVDRASGGMEKRWNKMASKVEARSNRMANQVRTAIAGVALGVAGREVVSYGDSWADMTNKVAAAGQVAGRQGRSLRELQKGAHSARETLEPYVDLYSRLLRVSAELADDEEEVARATNIIAKSFKAGGASAEEAAGGVIQLGQALGSGRLQGDEFKTLTESAPLLVKALRDGIGVTTGELRKMSAAGELTSDKVFKAIIDGADDIEAAFAVTIPRGTDAAVLAMDRLGLSVGEYLGQTNAVGSAAGEFAKVVNWAADNVDVLADALLIGAAALAGWLGASGLAAVGAGLAATATGATAAAKALALMRAAVGFLGGPWVIGITLAVAAITALAIRAGNARKPVEELNEKLDGVSDALREIAENAGASWEDIEQGARDAIVPVSELEQQYRDLRDAMEESGAAARQMAIDSVAVQKIEAVQAGGAAGNEIEALQSQRATQMRVSTGIVAREIDTTAIDERIAELEEVRARAQRTVAEADATMQHLFKKTTNEDFKPGANSPPPPPPPAVKGKTEAQLKAEFQLQEARAAGDKARAHALEDAASIEKRTAAYIKAGVDAATARVTAEGEVITLRQLALEKELKGIADTTAAKKREADIEKGAKAVLLRDIEKQNAIDLARVSGNVKLLRQLEREAEIERRILEYMEAGVLAAEARRRATSDTDTGIEAAAKGKFRETVSDAMTQAISTGNFGDAIKDVFADRASEGLRQALNSLSDVIFDLFKDVFSGANSGGGGGGFGDAIASFGASLFGGGRESGGPVSRGKFYEVNEGGKPELLNARGKTFLMPGANGNVTPMRGPSGRRGGGVNIDARTIVQGNVTEDVMPQFRREIADNNNRLMRGIPDLVDGRIHDGFRKGRFG